MRRQHFKWSFQFTETDIGENHNKNEINSQLVVRELYSSILQMLQFRIDKLLFYTVSHHFLSLLDGLSFRPATARLPTSIISGVNRSGSYSFV